MTIFTIGIPHVSPPVSLLNSPRNPGGVEPWGVEDGLSLATAGVHPKKSTVDVLKPETGRGFTPDVLRIYPAVN